MVFEIEEKGPRNPGAIEYYLAAPRKHAVHAVRQPRFSKNHARNSRAKAPETRHS